MLNFLNLMMALWVYEGEESGYLKLILKWWKERDRQERRSK